MTTEGAAVGLGSLAVGIVGPLAAGVDIATLGVVVPVVVVLIGFTWALLDKRIGRVESQIDRQLKDGIDKIETRIHESNKVLHAKIDAVKDQITEQALHVERGFVTKTECRDAMGRKADLSPPAPGGPGTPRDTGGYPAIGGGNAHA